MLRIIQEKKISCPGELATDFLINYLDAMFTLFRLMLSRQSK